MWVTVGIVAVGPARSGGHPITVKPPVPGSRGVGADASRDSARAWIGTDQATRAGASGGTSRAVQDVIPITKRLTPDSIVRLTGTGARARTRSIRRFSPRTSASKLRIPRSAATSAGRSGRQGERTGERGSSGPARCPRVGAPACA